MRKGYLSIKTRILNIQRTILWNFVSVFLCDWVYILEDNQVMDIDELSEKQTQHTFRIYCSAVLESFLEHESIFSP